MNLANFPYFMKKCLWYHTWMCCVCLSLPRPNSNFSTN